jgi:hypothetical protein
MTQVTRLSKHLTKHELSLLKKALKPYGAKTELSRATGLSVQTIFNIMKKRRGLAESIDAILNYTTVKAAA